MSESILEFMSHMFVGPLWPASLLVCCLLIFMVLSMLGGLDLDFGIDVDIDTDVDGDLMGGIGGVTLRWLNLNHLPVFLWLSIFTVIFWMTSYAFWYSFDVKRYEPTIMTSILLMLRNGVIAIGVTKVVTEPLNRYFQPAPSFGPSKLIGKTCEVSTGEATDSFGQARFRTDASPLILNIRTDGETLTKGSIVQIVAYDHDKHIYKVTAALEEVSE